MFTLSEDKWITNQNNWEILQFVNLSNRYFNGQIYIITFDCILKPITTKDEV